MMTFNSISGIVEDENFKPVEGATVALMLQSGGSLVEYTQTDSNGFYEFQTHNESDITEQEWHVSVYDDEAPLFNDFSKPFISARLNNNFGEWAASISYNGVPQIPFTITNLNPIQGNEIFFGFPDPDIEQIGQTNGLTLDPDGTRFHIMMGNGGNGELIYQLDLSTPFDLSTFSIDGTFPYETVDETKPTMLWADDGNRFYELSLSNIYQYDASTPYDLNTISLDKTVSTPGSGNGEMIKFTPDGSTVFVVNVGSTLSAYDLPTPYDVDNVQFLYNFQPPRPNSLDLTDMQFSDTGLKFFLFYSTIFDDEPSVLQEVNLSSPYDLDGSTTFGPSFDFGGTDGRTPTHIEWADDGRKLFVMSDSVVQGYRI